MTHFSLKASVWESMTCLTFIVNTMVAYDLAGTMDQKLWHRYHGPLASYVTLRVAHPLGMRESFPRHRWLAILTCITARAWCIPRLLTSGYLRSRWQGKRSRNSRRTRNPQFYVSRKKPILVWPGFINIGINLMIQQASVCIGKTINTKTKQKKTMKPNKR